MFTSAVFFVSVVLKWFCRTMAKKEPLWLEWTSMVTCRCWKRLENWSVYSLMEIHSTLPKDSLQWRH